MEVKMEVKTEVKTDNTKKVVCIPNYRPACLQA